jgi:hypothetical protein
LVILKSLLNAGRDSSNTVVEVNLEQSWSFCSLSVKKKGVQKLVNICQDQLLEKYAELGTRFFIRFALALSRSWAELFALALPRSFLGLKFCAFVFALSRSRAP